MSKKIFISYGNAVYYDSLNRIKQEAEQTGLFDVIITYTDDDLPEEVKKHPLLQYQRGGGYWLWKPYIILKALTEVAGENDIVIYSDAGNEIFADKEWTEYFDYLEEYSAVCFKYGGLIKWWTRKEVLDYFAPTCPHLSELWQIMGGLNLWSKKSIPVVQAWFDLMFKHPELVIDVQPEEMKHQLGCFREHRHDQAMLSGVVYANEKQHKIKVLWEHCESFDQKGQAVFCARFANTPERKLLGRPHKPLSVVRRMKRRLKMFIRDLRTKKYQK